MRYLKSFSCKVALLAAGLLLAGWLPAQAAVSALTVSPNRVQIGTFFSGQTVTVTGQVPAGAQVVLEVMGTSADEHLMRKGRRAGLWMNVGEITIHDAPSLYLVMSTSKELLTAPPVEATWGYKALEKRITFAGSIEAAETPEFLKQFLELKESENIYSSRPGTLTVKAAAGGESTVTGVFPLPTNTKPGTYKVCLSVIADGKVVDNACADLSVALVGFPAMLANLAYQHGLTYGIVAVVIAIVTGFAMGFLFKGGGGH